MLNTTHFTWAKVSCINQKWGVIKIVPLSSSFRGGKTRRQKINHPHPSLYLITEKRAEESWTMNASSVFQVCLGNSTQVLSVRPPAQRGKVVFSLALPTDGLRAHSSPSRARAAKASLTSDPQSKPCHLLDSDLNNNQPFSESKGGIKFLNHRILPISSATGALKNCGHLPSGSGSKSGLS